MSSNSFRAPLKAALFAAVASVALMASPAFAASLTRGVNNALAEAQKAEKAGDLAAATAGIAKARAVSGKTDYDDYMINSMAVNIAYKSQDMVAATAAAEGAADSPAIPEDQKQATLRTALILANNQKHFDKSVVYAKALAATNPTDATAQTAIIQAYYFAKDYPNAAAAIQKRLDADKAAGKPADRMTLQMMRDIKVAQNDQPGAEQILEQQVAIYNDPADWTQMIDVAISSRGIRDVEVIWLGRLLFASGAKPSQQDVDLFGSNASRLTFFGDAQVAKEHGGTGYPDPGPRAEADKKTIPAQIAAGAKQNGEYNAKLAEALYSYGMYSEAEAAAKLAISKGGTKDATEAPMVLGQSLIAQGKYDDAIAAFGQVQGGGPATARITRLWVALANIKKNPPAAAATAAAAPAK